MAKTTIFEAQRIEGFAPNPEFGLYFAYVAPKPFSFTLGEEYTIAWDGTEYKAAAQDASILNNGAAMTAVGNGSAFGLLGNNEPFAIATDQNILYFFVIDTTDTSRFHDVAIYQGEDASIVLKDRSGNDMLYSGVEYVALNDSEGGTKLFVSSDLVPEGVETTVDANFKDGDMEVVPGAKKQFTKVTVTAPPNLTPDNIRLGVNIAGVEGELIGDTEELTVDLNMAGGNQVIVPTAEGKVISQVTITKPDDLKPENVRSGKSIGGVEGEFIGDTEELNLGLDMVDGDQIIVPTTEGKVISKVTIAKPADLIPENIAKGIVIGGVEGTLGGAIERPPEDKPIRFYDPYGKVIYGYTRAEAQELTELPPGPPLSGVTFGGWTHTLDEIKATTYFTDVGPMYKNGSNWATVLVIKTMYPNSQLLLYIHRLSGSGSATIYWGDGASSTASGTSASSYSSHTYATEGTYVISIVTPTCIVELGGYSSTYYYSCLNYSGYVSQVANSHAPTATHPSTQVELVSMLFASAPGAIYKAKLSSAHSQLNLKFVSFYETTGTNPKFFMNCSNLVAIAGNVGLQNGSLSFMDRTRVQRVWLTTSVAVNTFVDCKFLEEVKFGSGTITDNNMNSKWAMLMTTETPPTIGASSPTWGTYPIYVPDAAVETYKTADKWSSAADYIVPRSRYKD